MILSVIDCQRGEWAYIPYHLEGMLHNGYTQVCSIVDKTGNIVLWHLGQLLLENALEARQDNSALPLPIVVDDSEFDFSVALFYYRRFLGEWDYAFHGGCGRLVGGRGGRGVLLYALGRAIGRVGSRFALGFGTRRISLQSVELCVRRTWTCL